MGYLRSRRKGEYQIERALENYFPCTHKLAEGGCLQHNIHIALQHLGVVYQLSCLFHSQIHDFLALISKRVSSQQLEFHLIGYPVIDELDDEVDVFSIWFLFSFIFYIFTSENVPSEVP